MQKEVKAPWDGISVSSYTWYAMREVNCLTLSQILMTDLGLSWRNHRYGREHSGVSSKTSPTYWRTWCHSSSSTPGAYTSSSSPRICSIHRDKVNSNIITSQKIANCRVGTPYKVGCSKFESKIRYKKWCYFGAAKLLIFNTLIYEIVLWKFA